MGEITPFREDKRRRMLQEAINRAAEIPETNGEELRQLWDHTESVHMTKKEMNAIRKRLRTILNNAEVQTKVANIDSAES